MSILLMTATVSPPSTATKLARADPIDRLDDYAKALAHYIELHEQGLFDALVFVENSDADLRVLKALAARSTRRETIEFLSFYGLDYPGAFGRGYGEMQIIEHAMQRSALIAAAPADAMIWKITGRYVLRNVGRLIDGSVEAELFCQCRDLPRAWADMYFMGWRKRAYAGTLAGAAGRLREDLHGRSSEVELRKLIDEKAKSMRVARRFAAVPQLSGIRGFDNRRFEEQGIKTSVRVVLGRLMPWVWI